MKESIKYIVQKHHKPDKDGSMFKVMLKTNTCFTYKEYLGKYKDTDQFTRFVSFSHFLFLRHRIICWPGPLPEG